MTALSPFAAAPLASLWTQAESTPAAPILPGDIPAGEGVWLARIGVSGRAGAAPAPAPVGLMAGAPMAAPDRPADLPDEVTEIRVSDRGWIGEPGDTAAPNVPYPARLLEPPAIEMSVPIGPEGSRRRAFQVGELRLTNGDGALDYLAGDWRIGGRVVELLRGPHTRPRHAAMSSFLSLARLRTAGAASGTTRLAIELRDAAADLTVPVAPLYAGTGGSEGPASLAGQPKPSLYGIKRRFEPVLVDPTRYIYQLHNAAIEAVLAVRDRGAAYSSGGADIASYAGLEATVPTAGTYRTCLAAGCIRVEPAGTGVSLLTVDARGDVSLGGYLAGTPASIALKLLRGPGGLPEDSIAPDAFGTWPVGEAGLLLRGGTVADAMDALAAGLAAWWGHDRQGRVTGGEVSAPEDVPALWEIEPWMLRAPPEEVPGLAEPPRWRHTVGYAAPGRVLNGADLADSVAAADRLAWGEPYAAAVIAEPSIAATYPLALDAPPLVSVFDAEGDATALAERLAARHGRPRRIWRALLNRVGLAVMPADALRLTWPRHGLTGGPVLIASSISLRGDRTDLLLWG